MWENLTRPRLGGVSLMRYALNFLLVLSATLFWAIISTPAAHAADATWESGSIIYQDNSYQGPTTVDREMSQRLGVPENSQYYQYIEQGDADTPDDVSQARFVTFGPGDSVEDATNAQVFSCELNTRTSQDEYSNCTNPTNVSIDAQSSIEGGGPQEETSCVVNGIGYIICPFMNFLADSMDKLFSVLQRFLNVEPIATDTEGSLYKTWSYMLALANVAFVIGFLVIIYSYISNQGVKQYDLRGIIPRLIIAAVLINSSYFICALAVDISNIAGDNLQDIFNNIRQDMLPNDVASNTSWSQAATFILSGGTIGAIAATGAVVVSGGAALTLLIPLITTAAIAILVVVVVLAARQALITVLIITAPIALAAFILPSTQKFFDKWKNLFMTMLIMYPMFSILFGGSQLASAIIAQNARSMEVVLFAMFIQVMPLVITPFLIKFSGNLLGRIAGMVNNPAKGLGDRANNWGTQKRSEAKDRRRNPENNKGFMKTPGIALSQKMDRRRRKREGMQKYNQSMQEAGFAETEAGQMIARNMSKAQMRQSTADNFNKAAFDELKQNGGKDGLRDAAIREKLSATRASREQEGAELYLQEIQSRSGAAHHGVAAGTPAAGMVDSLNNLSHERHAIANALQLAKEQDKLEYSQDMVKGVHADSLQTAAAGITGDKGKAQAAARAVQEMRADFGKSAAAMEEMMEHFKVTGSETMRLADPNNTTDVVKVSKDGLTKFTFKAGDEYTTDAAIKSLYEKKGNYASMKDVLVESGKDSHEDYLTTIISGVASGMTKKAPWLGGKNLDIITQGNIKSEQDLDNMVRATIADGKFKSEWLATGDAVGLNDIAALVDDNMNHSGLNAKQSAIYAKRIDNMRDMARSTLGNKNLEGALTDEARTQLRMIAGDITFKRS